MEWFDALTKKVRAELLTNAAAVLERVARCPATKDLAKDVPLGSFLNNECTLFLTNEGLKENTPHSCKVPVLTKSLQELVVEYRLSRAALENLYSQLMAEMDGPT